MMRVQGVRRTGSAALDLAYVACGRVDGFWEFGLKPWDVAAGALIVEEAGGHVSNIDGSPLELAGAQIIASNGRLHPEMVELLAVNRQEAERRHAEMLRESRSARPRCRPLARAIGVTTTTGFSTLSCAIPRHPPPFKAVCHCCETHYDDKSCVRRVCRAL